MLRAHEFGERLNHLAAWRCLVRIAKLYVNIAGLGRRGDIADCREMVTTMPVKLMNLSDYGIADGNFADIVGIDGKDGSSAIAELAQPLSR